jgi:hypothetical protein
MEPMMIALMQAGRTGTPSTFERELADAAASAEVGHPARKRTATRTLLKRFGL